RREQDVQGKAEDAQGGDGDEDQDDDRKHGGESPFRDSVSGVCSYASRLPPAAAPVDREQPRIAP
ncbi:MAG TPA: hypothetical protein VFQ68_46580, partial [Streptosporangiaceae bacterium]|nr:hypothetical protein [Streptosporangiaceae bacterium]